jgi:ATP-dependent 26S proteasome regulatory subunit
MSKTSIRYSLINIEIFSFDIILLVNRIVFGEQRIDFVYLGQSITFRVEQPTDEENLIDSLHSLSLDNNFPNFYRICPSTTSINIQFEPTTMNRNDIQDKSITLLDIGGLKKEKSDLTDLLLSSTLNYIPPRGILLHGPKGCGKTMLINAISHEISATIIRINPSDVYSRHYGESETKLKRYLDVKNVFLIATTNRLDSVDTDLRRPGRIDEEIEIGIPNQYDRLEVN